MAQSTLGAVGYINPPPATTSWQNPAVHPFNQVFGGQPISPELHPYDATDETTWTLPEALLGKSKFLGQTFELLAMMQNSFLLTVILPLIKTDEIQSHWSRWEFPAFIPDMVPHLGVVRFVKSNRISGRSTMARYGIGIFLEHGFMNTQEGMLHYVMNIRQLLAAVLEGMQLEALQALVNVGSYELALSRKIHPSNTSALAKTFNNVMKRDLFAWGCLQQNNNAWALLNKKIDEIVIECYQNNNPFTHYITSTKVDAFLHQIPYDQVTASIYGPDAQRKVRDGVQDFRVDEFNNKIFSSRPFIVEDNPVDPFERTVQIGEYIRCFNHIREQMENYKSSSRTQMIYDENADTFAKVTLRQKIDNCHRFDVNGNLLHIREARKHGDYSPENAVDFLHYRDPIDNSLKVIRYMFQLSPSDFNINDYQDFVTTFFNALQRQYGHSMADYERSIRELRDLLDIIGSYRYDSAMDAWLQLLSRKNTSVESNNGPNKTIGSNAGSVKNNIWGSLDVPSKTDSDALHLGTGIADVDSIADSEWVLPPTHGNYGGFKTISNMVRKGSIKDTIFSELYSNKVDQNLVLFEELADGIKKMLPGTVAASANFVNSSIHRADHRHALFENLVSINHNPRYVFLHEAGANVANAVGTAADALLVADRATLAARQRDFYLAVDNLNIARSQNPVDAGVVAAATAAATTAQTNLIAAQDALNLTTRRAPGVIMATERGMREDDYTGRRVEESMFPNIAESRKVVMSKILGNLEVSDVAASDFIGTAISYPRTGAAGAQTLKFSPIQSPYNGTKEGGTTKFAAARWTGTPNLVNGNLVSGNTPDFDGAVGTDTLAEAAGNPLFDKTVYDTIARWTFLEFAGYARTRTEYTQRVNFYGIQTAIVFAIAVSKVTSNISETYGNVARIIDKIQEVLGVKFHDTANPFADHRYTATRTSMFDARKLPELIGALRRLYEDTNGRVFSNNVTPASFEDLLSSITIQKDQILARAISSQPPNYTAFNPVAVPDHDVTRQGYVYHRNANISYYRQAPITLGREAMNTYPAYAYGGAGVRRAIPASFKNSSVMMSDVELDLARTIQDSSIDDNLAIDYLHEIGAVFAPDRLRSLIESEIDMLPLVSNASSRLRSPEEIQNAERQRVQNIRRETTVIGTRSSMGLQALIGGAQTFGNKRRRVGDSGANSVPVELPSTPASQTTVFERELIDPMRKTYTSLVKTFGDDPASLAIAVSYGFTPFTKQLLDSTVTHHLDHPVDYLVVRPHATYTTVGVIKMIPGLETGQMSFGNIIAEIGDDAAIQTHLVTETHYQGAVIKKPKNVCVFNDVLVTGYKGGLGSEPISIESYNPNVGKFGKNPAESIMYFMIPRHSVMSSNAFSIAGKAIWVDRQGNGESIDRVEDMGYATSDYYNAVWGFTNQNYNGTVHSYGSTSKYLNQVIIPNAVVFKSVAAFEDPLTRKFSRKSGNTGHFQSHTVGTGMHRARIGETSFKNIPINPLEQQYDISW